MAIDLPVTLLVMLYIETISSLHEKIIRMNFAFSHAC